MNFTFKKNTEATTNSLKKKSIRIDTMEKTTNNKNNMYHFHLGMISRIQNTGKCASCGEK